MADKTQEQEFRYPGVIASLQNFAVKEPKKHFSVVCERSSVVTQLGATAVCSPSNVSSKTFIGTISSIGGLVPLQTVERIMQHTLPSIGNNEREWLDTALTTKKQPTRLQTIIPMALQ